MAGETRGELAEAIAKVALESAVASRGRSDKVYWEEAPANSVIKPDLTTGESIDHPSNLLLINASESPKESEKKFWRNLAEVFGSKARLDPRPAVISLVFKSEIKPELIRFTRTLCDSAHLVDRDPVHGEPIARWLEGNHASAPSKKAGKEKLVRRAGTLGTKQYDASFALALRHLAQTLAPMLFRHRDELRPLWDLMQSDFESRIGGAVRPSRRTLLRRGLARWMAFGPEVRLDVVRAHLGGSWVPRGSVPDYSTQLGLLKRSLKGGRVPRPGAAPSDMVSSVSADLRAGAKFFLDAMGDDAERAALELVGTLAGAPSEMERIAGLLRAMPSRVGLWHRYVVARWDKLCTPAGCYEELQLCSQDSTMGGAVSDGAPSRVWLYDHLVGILRAHAGKNNDYGYGRLMGYFKDNQDDPTLGALLRETVETLDGRAERTATRWVDLTLPNSAEPGRRGFQDWLKGAKEVSPVIVAAFAFALASLLSEIDSPASIKSSGLVSAHAYGLWNKLLTYQDFEPLADLVESACGERVQRLSAETLLSDMAEQSVQNAGRIPVLSFSGGVICWKSVTDSGKAHKRKELAGRARALRFQFIDGRPGLRSSAERLLLVVDGTFDDDDLKVLRGAGWDEIYYPDEMDRLVAAIVGPP